MNRWWSAMLLGVLAVLALFLFLNFRGRDKIHDLPPLTPPTGESVARSAYPAPRTESDRDAAVLSHIRAAWGNRARP